MRCSVFGTEGDLRPRASTFDDRDDPCKRRDLHSTKTCRALDRSTPRSGLNALHPGVIRTNLGRDAGGFLTGLMSLFAVFMEKNVAQGAATQCYVATHPDLDGVSGAYFSDCKQANCSSYGRNDLLAKELWEASIQLAEGYLD